MRRLLIHSLLLTTLGLAANAQTTPTIMADGAWARSTTSPAQAGAVYLTIMDHGEPDRLIAISTPVATKAELHETIKQGDIMKMRPVAALPISSAAPISLTPGGYHIMLTGLQKPLAAGQTFPLSLHFEKAGDIETTVMVKPAGAGGGMDMGGAGHDMQHMTMPGTSKP